MQTIRFLKLCCPSKTIENPLFIPQYFIFFASYFRGLHFHLLPSLPCRSSVNVRTFHHVTQVRFCFLLDLSVGAWLRLVTRTTFFYKRSQIMLKTFSQHSPYFRTHASSYFLCYHTPKKRTLDFTASNSDVAEPLLRARCIKAHCWMEAGELKCSPNLEYMCGWKWDHPHI